MEKKEEWEKRFDKRYDQYNPINDDGTQVATWCGSDYEDMKSFISELLLEREKEAVLKYILSLGWQDTDNEYVKEVLEDAEKITSELSKLTTK